MAGGGPPVPEGSGGKKSVDFNLNLVPFIDLMSAMISFLLITAVWSQVAKIDVKQKPNLPTEDTPPPPPDEEQINLAILVEATGYKVMKRGEIVKEILKKGDAYDTEALRTVLKAQKAEHPENSDVEVRCENKVPYKELITVMDAALEHDLPGISVSGVET